MADRLIDAGAVAIIPRESVVETYDRPDGRSYRKQYDRAIFPGYVFLNADPELAFADDPRGSHWWALRECPYTRGIVQIRNQSRFRWELGGLLTWLGSCDHRITVTKIEPGMMVRVVNGPFRNVVSAWLVDRIDGAKVYLPINFMGRMVETEVSIDDVEPAYLD